MEKYLDSDLDDPKYILSTLGSFWASQRQDLPLLEDICEIKGRLAQECRQSVRGILDALSRFKLAAYRSKSWYPLTISETLAELDNNQFAKYLTDTPYTYSNPPQISYGQRIRSSDFLVRKPPGLVSATLVTSGINDLECVWVEGTDYLIEKNVLRLKNNPFKLKEFKKTPVFDNQGSQIDNNLILWLYQSKWDFQDFFYHFSHVLSGSRASTAEALNFFNAVFNAAVRGTSETDQIQLISSLFNFPTVLETEKIEEIQQISDLSLVLTDKNYYVLDSSSTLQVQENDIIQKNRPISDELDIFELSQNWGRLAKSEIDGLSLGSEYLGDGYIGSLTFVNQELPIESEFLAGEHYGCLPVFGYPDDIATFKKRSAESGKKLNDNLFNYFPNGSTINPFRFVVEHILRNTTTIVKVKKRRLFNLDLSTRVDLLKSVQPPHCSIMFLFSTNFEETVGTLFEPLSEAFLGLNISVFEEDSSVLSTLVESVAINNNQVYCE
jgi:hypothetical protein